MATASSNAVVPSKLTVTDIAPFDGKIACNGHVWEINPNHIEAIDGAWARKWKVGDQVEFLLESITEKGYIQIKNLSAGFSTNFSPCGTWNVKQAATVAGNEVKIRVRTIWEGYLHSTKEIPRVGKIQMITPDNGGFYIENPPTRTPQSNQWKFNDPIAISMHLDGKGKVDKLTLRNGRAPGIEHNIDLDMLTEVCGELGKAMAGYLTR